VIIAIITIWAFLFNIIGTELAWAQNPTGSVLPPTSTRAEGSPGHILSKLEPSQFKLPTTLGSVKETHTGYNKKTVIHIQDAHCNYSAQESVKGIIEFLNASYGVDLVTLEGGEGDYDFSVFTDIEDLKLREKVARYFTKEGRINGAELASIMNPGMVTLKGIERAKFYKENLDVYKDHLEHKDSVDQILDQIDNYILETKDKTYSSQLKELDAKSKAYHSQRLSFKEYLNYILSLQADLTSEAIQTYENLFQLTKIIEEEHGIDFKTCDREKEEIIRELKSVLPKSELKNLVKWTVQFKTGLLKQDEFYLYLLEKAKFNSINISKYYPNLIKYSRFLKKYESLDKKKVFSEFDELEKYLFTSLLETKEQRKLYELSRDFDILKKLFSASLSKKEFDYYLKNKRNFKGSRFFSNDTNVSEVCKALDIHRTNFEKFYTVSLKRDKAFMKNIKTYMKNKDTAVLFTGGFHTENLKELLKKQGYSYIVILPKFDPTEKTPYFKLLSGGLSPIEEEIREKISGIAIPSPNNHLVLYIYGTKEGKLRIEIFEKAVKEVKVNAAPTGKKVRMSPVAVSSDDELKDAILLDDEELKDQEHHRNRARSYLGKIITPLFSVLFIAFTYLRFMHTVDHDSFVYPNLTSGTWLSHVDRCYFNDAITIPSFTCILYLFNYVLNIINVIIYKFRSRTFKEDPRNIAYALYCRQNITGLWASFTRFILIVATAFMALNEALSEQYDVMRHAYESLKGTDLKGVGIVGGAEILGTLQKFSGTYDPNDIFILIVTGVFSYILLTALLYTLSTYRSSVKDFVTGLIRQDALYNEHQAREIVSEQGKYEHTGGVRTSPISGNVDQDVLQTLRNLSGPEDFHKFPEGPVKDTLLWMAENNIKGWVIGGAVTSMLMGQETTTDIDIAIDVRRLPLIDRAKTIFRNFINRVTGKPLIVSPDLRDLSAVHRIEKLFDYRWRSIRPDSKKPLFLNGIRLDFAGSIDGNNILYRAGYPVRGSAPSIYNVGISTSGEFFESDNAVRDMDEGILRPEPQRGFEESEAIYEGTMLQIMRLLGEKHRRGFTLTTKAERLIFCTTRAQRSRRTKRLLREATILKESYPKLEICLSEPSTSSDRMRSVDIPEISDELEFFDVELYISFSKAVDPLALAEDLKKAGLGPVIEKLFDVSPEILADQAVEARTSPASEEIQTEDRTSPMGPDEISFSEEDKEVDFGQLNIFGWPHSLKILSNEEAHILMFFIPGEDAVARSRRYKVTLTREEVMVILDGINRISENNIPELLRNIRAEGCRILMAMSQQVDDVPLLLNYNKYYFDLRQKYFEAAEALLVKIMTLKIPQAEAIKLVQNAIPRHPPFGILKDDSNNKITIILDVDLSKGDKGILTLGGVEFDFASDPSKIIYQLANQGILTRLVKLQGIKNDIGLRGAILRAAIFSEQPQLAISLRPNEVCYFGMLDGVRDKGVAYLHNEGAVIARGSNGKPIPGLRKDNGPEYEAMRGCAINMGRLALMVMYLNLTEASKDLIKDLRRTQPYPTEAEFIKELKSSEGFSDRTSPVETDIETQKVTRRNMLGIMAAAGALIAIGDTKGALAVAERTGLTSAQYKNYKSACEALRRVLAVTDKNASKNFKLGVIYLMLATAVHESDLEKRWQVGYRRQKGSKKKVAYKIQNGARGLWQIEPATAYDMVKKYLQVMDEENSLAVARGPDELYTLQKGDNYSKVAKKFYGTSSKCVTDFLEQKNGIPSRKLTAGQKIKVPKITINYTLQEAAARFAGVTRQKLLLMSKAQIANLIETNDAFACFITRMIYRKNGGDEEIGRLPTKAQIKTRVIEIVQEARGRKPTKKEEKVGIEVLFINRCAAIWHKYYNRSKKDVPEKKRRFVLLAKEPRFALNRYIATVLIAIGITSSYAQAGVNTIVQSGISSGISVVWMALPVIGILVVMITCLKSGLRVQREEAYQELTYDAIAESIRESDRTSPMIGDVEVPQELVDRFGREYLEEMAENDFLKFELAIASINILGIDDFINKLIPILDEDSVKDSFRNNPDGLAKTMTAIKEMGIDTFITKLIPALGEDNIKYVFKNSAFEFTYAINSINNLGIDVFINRLMPKLGPNNIKNAFRNFTFGFAHALITIDNLGIDVFIDKLMPKLGEGNVKYVFGHNPGGLALVIRSVKNLGIDIFMQILDKLIINERVKNGMRRAFRGDPTNFSIAITSIKNIGIDAITGNAAKSFSIYMLRLAVLDLSFSQDAYLSNAALTLVAFEAEEAGQASDGVITDVDGVRRLIARYNAIEARHRGRPTSGAKIHLYRRKDIPAFTEEELTKFQSEAVLAGNMTAIEARPTRLLKGMEEVELELLFPPSSSSEVTSGLLYHMIERGLLDRNRYDIEVQLTFEGDLTDKAKFISFAEHAVRPFEPGFLKKLVSLMGSQSSVLITGAGVLDDIIRGRKATDKKRTDYLGLIIPHYDPTDPDYIYHMGAKELIYGLPMTLPDGRSIKVPIGIRGVIRDVQLMSFALRENLKPDTDKTKNKKAAIIYERFCQTVIDTARGYGISEKAFEVTWLGEYKKQSDVNIWDALYPHLDSLYQAKMDKGDLISEFIALFNTTADSVEELVRTSPMIGDVEVPQKLIDVFGREFLEEIQRSRPHNRPAYDIIASSGIQDDVVGVIHTDIKKIMLISTFSPTPTENTEDISSPDVLEVDPLALSVSGFERAITAINNLGVDIFINRLMPALGEDNIKYKFWNDPNVFAGDITRINNLGVDKFINKLMPILVEENVKHVFTHHAVAFTYLTIAIREIDIFIDKIVPMIGEDNVSYLFGSKPQEFANIIAAMNDIGIDNLSGRIVSSFNLFKLRLKVEALSISEEKPLSNAAVTLIAFEAEETGEASNGVITDVDGVKERIARYNTIEAMHSEHPTSGAKIHLYRRRDVETFSAAELSKLQSEAVLAGRMASIETRPTGLFEGMDEVELELLLPAGFSSEVTAGLLYHMIERGFLDRNRYDIEVQLTFEGDLTDKAKFISFAMLAARPYEPGFPEKLVSLMGPQSSVLISGAGVLDNIRGGEGTSTERRDYLGLIIPHYDPTDPNLIHHMGAKELIYGLPSEDPKLKGAKVPIGIQRVIKNVQLLSSALRENLKPDTDQTKNKDAAHLYENFCQTVVSTATGYGISRDAFNVRWLGEIDGTKNIWGSLYPHLNSLYQAKMDKGDFISEFIALFNTTADSVEELIRTSPVAAIDSTIKPAIPPAIVEMPLHNNQATASSITINNWPEPTTIKDITRISDAAHKKLEAKQAEREKFLSMIADEARSEEVIKYLMAKAEGLAHIDPRIIVVAHTQDGQTGKLTRALEEISRITGRNNGYANYIKLCASQESAEDMVNMYSSKHPAVIYEPNYSSKIPLEVQLFAFIVQLKVLTQLKNIKTLTKTVVTRPAQIDLEGQQENLDLMLGMIMSCVPGTIYLPEESQVDIAVPPVQPINLNRAEEEHREAEEVKTGV